MIKARKPINCASFGPDALKAIGQAFDESWASLADNYGDDQVEAARLRLADALLSIANDDSRDVEAMKTMALGMMRAESNWRWLSWASELATASPASRSLSSANTF